MKVRIAAIVTISFVVLGATDDRHGVGPMETRATTLSGRSDDGRPRFDANNALRIPNRYREWVFVGSSLGLGYDGNEKSAKAATEQLGHFQHVYINRLGYRAFRDTGRFPVGTMLILEGVSRGEKTSPQLRGYFSDQFHGLEAAVKTGDRFDDPWTYFSFTKNGKRQSKAERLTTKSCIDCHRKHGATDHVFTQFYPVLRAVRPTK